MKSRRSESADQIVGNLKVKEQEFTITEYAVIERNPKKDGEQLPDIKSSESGDAGSETQTTVN